MFAGAHGEDIVVDAPDLSVRPAAAIDASCRSIHSANFDSGAFAPAAVLGVCLGHNRVQDHSGARTSSGRDPPAPIVATDLAAFAPAFFRAHRRASATDGSVSVLGPWAIASLNSVRNTGGQRRRKADTTFSPRRVCDGI